MTNLEINTMNAMAELGMLHEPEAHEVYAYVAQYGRDDMGYEEILNLAFDAMNEVVYA